MAHPRGCSILVKVAIVGFLASLPSSTIVLAKHLALSTFFINAPLPTLTSNTIESAPLANFLDIIEDAINGIESTVAVTSRKAYKSLSAGATFAV